MSSSIQLYNGYHVTSNLYSQGYADGSLFRSIQAGTTAPTYGLPNNSSFYQNLMQAQQNLFSGWNNFCGCNGPRPQQPSQPTRQCQGGEQTNTTGENPNVRRRKPLEIHVHHHFYKNNCGGAFTCNQGQGSNSTNQSHNAFGSYGAVNRWTESSRSSGCYSPFQNTYQTFGYGNPGSPGGVFGTGYGNGYNYGGASYGNSYGNSYGGGYQSYGSNFGGYQSYNQAYGNYQNAYQNAYQNSSQQLPSYNWGDFNYSWGNSSNSPFGVLPSAYAGYAMTSPFTDFGTASGIAGIASALSLLF